jgi:hypothetical protein
MPGGVVRIGDILGPGGVIGPPIASGIYVNGRPAALVGAVYSSHPCCGAKKCPPTHCFGAIGDVPVGVFFNGIPPLTKSGIGLCKHKVMTASPDVIVSDGGMLGLAMSLAGAALGGPEGLAKPTFVEQLTQKIAFDIANQVVTQAGRN